MSRQRWSVFSYRAVALIAALALGAAVAVGCGSVSARGGGSGGGTRRRRRGTRPRGSSTRHGEPTTAARRRLRLGLAGPSHTSGEPLPRSARSRPRSSAGSRSPPSEAARAGALYLPVRSATRSRPRVSRPSSPSPPSRRPSRSGSPARGASAGGLTASSRPGRVGASRTRRLAYGPSATRYICRSRSPTWSMTISGGISRLDRLPNRARADPAGGDLRLGACSGHGGADSC